MKAAGGVSAVGIGTELLSNLFLEEVEVPEGLSIVFQGDSITDAGRDRGNY